MQYIGNVSHLMLIMQLLRDESKSISFEAFHIFKARAASHRSDAASAGGFGGAMVLVRRGAAGVRRQPGEAGGGLGDTDQESGPHAALPVRFPGAPAAAAQGPLAGQRTAAEAADGAVACARAQNDRDDEEFDKEKQVLCSVLKQLPPLPKN